MHWLEAGRSELVRQRRAAASRHAALMALLRIRVGFETLIVRRQWARWLLAVWPQLRGMRHSCLRVLYAHYRPRTRTLRRLWVRFTCALLGWQVPWTPHRQLGRRTGSPRVLA